MLEAFWVQASNIFSCSFYSHDRSFPYFMGEKPSERNAGCALHKCAWAPPLQAGWTSVTSSSLSVSEQLEAPDLCDCNPEMPKKWYVSGQRSSPKAARKGCKTVPAPPPGGLLLIASSTQKFGAPNGVNLSYQVWVTSLVTSPLTYQCFLKFSSK